MDYLYPNLYAELIEPILWNIHYRRHPGDLAGLEDRCRSRRPLTSNVDIFRRDACGRTNVVGDISQAKYTKCKTHAIASPRRASNANPTARYTSNRDHQFPCPIPHPQATTWPAPPQSSPTPPPQKACTPPPPARAKTAHPHPHFRARRPHSAARPSDAYACP